MATHLNYDSPQSINTTETNSKPIYIMCDFGELIESENEKTVEFYIKYLDNADALPNYINSQGELFIQNNYLNLCINRAGRFSNYFINDCENRTNDDPDYLSVVYKPTNLDIFLPNGGSNFCVAANDNDYYNRTESSINEENTKFYTDVNLELTTDDEEIKIVEWSAKNIDGNIELRHIYTLRQNSKKIEIETTITNISGESLSNIRYIYALNPGFSPIYSNPITYNKIRNQHNTDNKAVVTAKYNETNSNDDVGVILYGNNSSINVASIESAQQSGPAGNCDIASKEIDNDGNWRSNSNLQESTDDAIHIDGHIYLQHGTTSTLEPSELITFEYNIQLYNGEYSDALLDVVCFLRGSKILCADGSYVNIEDLTTAHIIKINGACGQKKVHSLAQGRILHNNSKRDKNMLYVYKADKFNLIEDLVITGNHSVLIDNLSKEERGAIVNDMGRVFVTGNKYRLPAYLDNRNSLYDINGDYEIWHLALENTDPKMNYGIWANGLLVETCSIYHLEKKLQNMKII